MKTLGESHGIILCTHILPEVQAVCNRVQIINRGKLVYSSDMATLLNTPNTKFEITLCSMIKHDELSGHAAFKSIEIIDDYHFIAESDFDADKLSAYIVEQKWGLTRFTTHEVSLEKIFIELTAGETGTSSAEEAA